MSEKELCEKERCKDELTKLKEEMNLLKAKNKRLKDEKSRLLEHNLQDLLEEFLKREEAIDSNTDCDSDCASDCTDCCRCLTDVCRCQIADCTQLASMTSMPKIATDIIEKKTKARDLKQKENITKEKTPKDKLIEKNVKEAIMKSLENPGKVIPVDRSWAYDKPVLRPTNTNKAMRLTDEMNDECRAIKNRMDELRSKFYREPRFDQHFYNRWDKLRLFHGDELQSYKVKLENFYSDTDAKEKFKPIKLLIPLTCLKGS